MMNINREMLYGLPHLDCRYTGESVNSHKLNDDAMCVCCGLPATNAHHYPPKGTAPTRKRHGFILKPALFAVCGSGTLGCHNDWHGGARYVADWGWDEPQFKDQWESGELLERYGPHSMELYKLGCWTIYDKRTGLCWEERRG